MQTAEDLKSEAKHATQDLMLLNKKDESEAPAAEQTSAVERSETKSCRLNCV